MDPFWDCRASVAKPHLECNLFIEKIYVSKRHHLFSLMFALRTANHMKILLDIFDYPDLCFYFYCLEIISRCLFQPSLVLNFCVLPFPFKFFFPSCAGIKVLNSALKLNLKSVLSWVYFSHNDLSIAANSNHCELLVTCFPTFLIDPQIHWLYNSFANYFVTAIKWVNILLNWYQLPHLLPCNC